MNRRDFLKTTGLGAAALLAPHTAQAKADAMPDKPNILLIFSDQQRWDTVECYGEPVFKGLTPNLDRMAAEGVRFQNSFTCQPVCGPARAALQTGKHATQTTCFMNNIALPRNEKTMAHLLSEAGYEVGYLGKWHLASDGDTYPDVPPFNCRTKPVPTDRRGGYKDYWLASDVLEFTSHGHDGHMFDAEGNRREFPEGRYRVDAQTDWAIEYLRGRKNAGTTAKPFFLMLSYIEPHHQNDHHHFEGPHGSKDKYRHYRVPGDLAETKGDWRREMPDYLGCCASLDANVGRIRDELATLGLAGNTLILYTSDHACHFRTRNGEYKRSCHDNSIRTPLIACGPGFEGGKVVEQVVSLVDVTPTVLAAGGVKLPEYLAGGPLQGLVDGSAQDWPEEAFVQISESGCGRAIRTARWTYCVRAPKGKARFGCRDSEVYQEAFLYDLQADPHQKSNLVASPDHAETRAELLKALLRRMAQAGEKPPRILPA
jgi:arylsulfatase A-like enzyme